MYGLISIRSESIRFATSPRAAAPITPSAGPTTDLTGLREDVARLSDFLGTLDRLQIRKQSETRTETVIGAAAQSPLGTNLGLQDRQASAARLESTTQLNTTPTSYTPFGPSFNGASTALPTIGGVYNGQNGSQTLTFRVAGGNGTVGSALFTRVEVRDESNQLLDNISIGFQPAGSVYTLQNGLTLSLSSGTLRVNNTFTVEVFANVGSAPDPSKAFNGTRNNSPNLQPGLAVTSGSFRVNGATINVLANDSINSVLTKITQSTAGVTATYDAAGERVLLTQKTEGAAPTITLDNDTSGFLAAAKLTGAPLSPGQDAGNDADRPLGELAGFQGVTSGSLVVNGEEIAFNTAADSLRSILDRVSQSLTGADATLDAAGQRVQFRSRNASANLSLDDNGTGLLSALGLTSATYEPSRSETTYRRTVSTVVPQQARNTAVAVERFAELFSDLFDEENAGSYAAQLRKSVERVVTAGAPSDLDTFRTQLGLTFDFRGDATQAARAEDDDALASRIRKNAAQYNRLMFGDATRSSGLVDDLRTLLEKAEADLNRQMVGLGVKG
ncbi:hypothetical protein [Planctomyces sp. SH-PL14]|uniref:hypothetical protein n=1 Tax=Planctomyces sp. SH-PL14 TaxID=1632864 RepID=UPI0009465995|nr:hypothetical protein [Planctomyces sp. SH-PL14]